MKSGFCLFPFLLLPTAFAVEPPPAKPKAVEKSGWVFSLLPKSLQKNPHIEVTVITEMTEEGKKLPLVTPAQPAFYIMQSSGYRRLGDSTGTSQKTVPPADLERILGTALASNGYRPAEASAQAPSLAIFYTWGTHNLLVEADDENPSQGATQVAANLLDRARLVGGEKFARKMLELFRQADDLNIAAGVPIPADGQPPIGPAQQAFLNPVALFKMQDPKNEFLVDQASHDIYYVVASAYDYRALAEKRRTLLWRTSMTVASQGVSEEQTLPTVIATAAPFFGREMTGPEVLTKRAVREGQVEMGTPTVVPSAENPTSEKK
jgi:hypothetical protein